MNTEEWVLLGYVIGVVVTLLLARIPGFVDDFQRHDYMCVCLIWPFTLFFLLCVGVGMAIVWPLGKIGNWIMGPPK